MSAHLAHLGLIVSGIIISLLFPILSAAAQATLTWDASEPDPQGYRIYHRVENQAYDYEKPVWIGSGTTGSVENLEANTRYHFIVRAFKDDQESADSEEVSMVVPPTYVNIRLEAEGGNLQWPMQIAIDEDAGAGGYVWVPTVSTMNPDPSNPAGSTTYRFDVPESGDYLIWGLHMAAEATGDTFSVSVDGQAQQARFVTSGGQGDWACAPLVMKDETDPALFHLTKGANILILDQIEAGVKLDRLLISNDPAPADLQVEGDGPPDEGRRQPVNLMPIISLLLSGD